jgi:D-alanyl-D-alanine carboxypeptidase
METTEHLLHKIVNNNNSPSVQYIMFNKDNIIKRYSVGFADISQKKTSSDKTTYNAYSVTKTFTALAIMQLYEQKAIDIYQPVKKYLPEFPFKDIITIKHLLSHTSGIPNPIPLNWIHLNTEHALFDRDQFFKKILEKNNKVLSAPGQKFSYSNLGYVLLGQLIEKVSGVQYEQYINENIIQKLGLTNHELGFEIPDLVFHSKGYQKRFTFTNLILGLFIDKSKFMGNPEGKWKPFYNFYTNGASYGGLIGTPDGFVKYIQELLKSDNRLLSDFYMKLMFTENSIFNHKPTGMCLSWFTGHLNGIRFFAHAGGGGGYYCEIRLYPEKGIGSVIFLNRTGMRDERILSKLDVF